MVDLNSRHGAVPGIVVIACSTRPLAELILQAIELGCGFNSRHGAVYSLLNYNCDGTNTMGSGARWLTLIGDALNIACSTRAMMGLKLWALERVSQTDGED